MIRAYADTNGDGTLQATETTIAASDTTHTAGLVDGSYLLTLNPGKYVVCEVLQATWIQLETFGEHEVLGDQRARRQRLRVPR